MKRAGRTTMLAQRENSWLS